MSRSDTWTPEMIAKLRDLWEQTNPQLSTKAIGDQLGISKNAVIGKAGRLHLSDRPSPIKRDDISQAPKPQRLPSLEGPTLPPLASADLDQLSSTMGSGPPPAWTAWCDQLPHNVFNAIRRTAHRADCPINRQRMSLRLWECTCGVSQPGSEVAAVPVKRQVVSKPVGKAIVRVAVPESDIIIPPTIFKPRRLTTCCWIDGDDKKTFVYCDDPAVSGRSYCPSHAAKAYVRTRSRSDDVTVDQSAA